MTGTIVETRWAMYSCSASFTPDDGDHEFIAITPAIQNIHTHISPACPNVPISKHLSNVATCSRFPSRPSLPPTAAPRLASEPPPRRMRARIRPSLSSMPTLIRAIIAVSVFGCDDRVGRTCDVQELAVAIAYDTLVGSGGIYVHAIHSASWVQYNRHHRHHVQYCVPTRCA
jgi:hypothetical protein